MFKKGDLIEITPMLRDNVVLAPLKEGDLGIVIEGHGWFVKVYFFRVQKVIQMEHDEIQKVNNV